MAGFPQQVTNCCEPKKRGWNGSPMCCVCGKPETINHIFFECVFAQFVWSCIRDAFGLGRFPISLQDLISEWLPRRLGFSKRLCFAFFASLAWAMWKNRNKMAIEKDFPSNPEAVIHTALNFMQIWIDLQKESDKNKMELVQGLTGWMDKEKMSSSCSDVAII